MWRSGVGAISVGGVSGPAIVRGCLEGLAGLVAGLTQADVVRRRLVRLADLRLQQRAARRAVVLPEEHLHDLGGADQRPELPGALVQRPRPVRGAVLPVAADRAERLL